MAPLPKNTAFVLVPGAFSPGEYYHKVTSLLREAGYEVAQLDLLTVGRRSSPPSMYDDAEHVRSEILKLADQGKDVVLVGNSYGGTVISEAPKGVTKSDRQAADKSGGVTHLIYIASLLAPVGTMTRKFVMDVAPPGHFQAEDGYYKPLEAGGFGMMMFPSLSEEERKRYTAMRQPMSTLAFEDPLTFAAWEHIPTTIILGGSEKRIAPAWVGQYIDGPIAKRNGMVRKSPLETDHAGMLTHPKEIVEVLLSDPPA